MNVPSNIMKIRLDRASELVRYAQLLEKYNLGRPFQILEAAKILQDKSQAFHRPDTADYSCWGYNIENLTFYLAVEGRHIYPDNVKTLEVSIDTYILCDFKCWRTFKDPFIKMNFRAKIRGIDDSGVYSFGFHIDKHDETLETDEVHPIYHIQYVPRVEESIHLGQVLSMDTPRIMHLPVDVILGTDLVLSNFAPSIWKKMRDENEYHAIFKDYQESFWRPYVHTLATKWTFNNAAIDWNGKHLICPNLSE